MSRSTDPGAFVLSSDPPNHDDCVPDSDADAVEDSFLHSTLPKNVLNPVINQQFTPIEDFTPTEKITSSASAARLPLDSIELTLPVSVQVTDNELNSSILGSTAPKIQKERARPRPSAAARAASANKAIMANSNTSSSSQPTGTKSASRSKSMHDVPDFDFEGILPTKTPPHPSNDELISKALRKNAELEDKDGDFEAGKEAVDGVWGGNKKPKEARKTKRKSTAGKPAKANSNAASGQAVTKEKKNAKAPKVSVLQEPIADLGEVSPPTKSKGKEKQTELSNEFIDSDDMPDTTINPDNMLLTTSPDVSLAKTKSTQSSSTKRSASNKRRIIQDEDSDTDPPTIPADSALSAIPIPPNPSKKSKLSSSATDQHDPAGPSTSKVKLSIPISKSSSKRSSSQTKVTPTEVNTSVVADSLPDPSTKKRKPVIEDSEEEDEGVVTTAPKLQAPQNANSIKKTESPPKAATGKGKKDKGKGKAREEQSEMLLVPEPELEMEEEPVVAPIEAEVENLVMPKLPEPAKLKDEKPKPKIRGLAALCAKMPGGGVRRAGLSKNKSARIPSLLQHKGEPTAPRPAIPRPTKKPKGEVYSDEEVDSDPLEGWMDADDLFNLNLKRKKKGKEALRFPRPGN